MQHHRNLVALLVAGFLISYALGLVSAICEFGQRMSDAFDEIEDGTQMFDWYLFPYEIQRMLPIILSSAQQPVALKCFGNVSAIRQNSKNVSFDSKLIC